MKEEYEKQIIALKREIKEWEQKYKELGRKYTKVSDELILLKAGKPVRRIQYDNIRSK